MPSSTIKISITVFTEIEKVLKLMENSKKFHRAKAILTKKNKVRGSTLPDFKMYL